MDRKLTWVSFFTWRSRTSDEYSHGSINGAGLSGLSGLSGLFGLFSRSGHLVCLVYSVYLVCLVGLVWLVYLVCLPPEADQPPAEVCRFVGTLVS